MPDLTRFGLTLFPTMRRRSDWTAVVKRAESSGIGTITVVDHFGSSGGIFPSLVAAAAVSASLRVGTLVLNNDFWHPCLLARETVTADVLTDGRFELGIGAGWNEADYRAMGVVKASASDRVARLEESLQILRQALDGGTVRFKGRFYEVETVELPRPAQPHIPLLVGGGSRRVLEAAGRFADIVSIHRSLRDGSLASWSETRAHSVADKIEWVRAGAGDRFAGLRLHSLVQRCVVTTRRREVATSLGEPFGLGPDQVLASPHFLIGTVEEMADDLKARQDRWGISYWTIVGERDLDAAAPVIERLAA